MQAVRAASETAIAAQARRRRILGSLESELFGKLGLGTIRQHTETPVGPASGPQAVAPHGMRSRRLNLIAQRYGNRTPVKPQSLASEFEGMNLPTFGKLRERQRSMPRARANRHASLASAEKRYFLTLVDVSRTGARLNGAEIPEEGEDVLFRAADVEMLATVVRSAETECAIDFATPIAAPEVQRLQA